jgi:uncharacterized protein
MPSRRTTTPILLGLLGLTIALAAYKTDSLQSVLGDRTPTETIPITSPKIQQLLTNAQTQTQQTHSYDPAYVAIAYPKGDVPIATGVCTDVVIRGFRGAGVDLQQVVHEDMLRHFSQYPNEWGLASPDPNIDHRRVPNLMRFFERQGKSLPVTQNAADYLPGDVVTWDLGEGAWHTGLVSNLKSRYGFGAGDREADHCRKTWWGNRSGFGDQ